ncbi:TetR/AcrR family transcriptional regulator [Streptodolium elevatio]|uniref:Helix-turn-helix domain-containing protein n=1 Tax=Streptodolium elevatio TaxID=3157996 RepID=A0ABV3DQ07_9ACTN
MPDQHSTLRARRRAETQRTVQAHAVRLFTERGFDATTVADVADAAGVSPMTVYRHFPTKEDLVLADANVGLVADGIAATPANLPLTHRIGSALVDSAAQLSSGDVHDPGSNRRFLLARLQLMIATPALRARHLDNHYALQQSIVGALTGESPDPDTVFRAQAAAGACLAAMHTALVRWAEDDGRTDLPDLIAQALAAAFGDDAIGSPTRG